MTGDLSLLGLGALIGYLARPAPTPAEIDDLRVKKPEFYDIVDIDLSTARNNQEYSKSGNFIWVDNQFARGSVTLRLNESEFKQLDLRRQIFVQGPFYRFFITNVAGQGAIRLIISRGYNFASKPVEAIDMAELAVRLGSISNFDRRGNVICQHNFDAGINKFLHDTSGKDASVSWSSARSRSSAYSCLLTAGSDGSCYAGIYKYMPFPAMGRLGFEISFALADLIRALVLDMRIFTGTQLLYPSISYDRSTGTVNYYDSAGVYTALSPVTYCLGSEYLFNTIKVVVDYENEKYMRLMLNNVTYDLRQYAINTSANTGIPRVYFGILNYGRAGYNDKVYVDDMIVTQNEP